MLLAGGTIRDLGTLGGNPSSASRINASGQVTGGAQTACGEKRPFLYALPLSPESFERIQALRRLVYNSQDYREGQRAFLEKRPPVFGGE